MVKNRSVYIHVNDCDAELEDKHRIMEKFKIFKFCKNDLQDPSPVLYGYTTVSTCNSSVNTPSISACTTATSLSTMTEMTGTDASAKSVLEGNLRVAQPNIEHLHTELKPLKTRNQNHDDDDDDKLLDQTVVYNNPTFSSKSTRRIHRQVLTALSVSLVSLVIGFVSAYTSPAQATLTEDLQITEHQYSWVCGLMPLSALLGGLVGGQMIEFIGRKKTIALTDMLYVLSWLLVANAKDIWYVYIGRAVVGFSVGIASLVLPVYLGETIQPEVRGTLGLLPAALGNTGILLCFVAGSYLRWYNLAWLGFALPMPFLILMFLIPETPRWYVSKGRDEEAKRALKWLRGGNDTDVSEEFDDLVKTHQQSMKMSSNNNIAELFSTKHLKPLLISLGLMFFQQLSGINAVIFYTTTIFKMAGSTINEDLCTIIVGLVNFISTFLATMLIDRLGRKVLLYISSISMIITLIILGTYFYFLQVEFDVSPYGWLPLVSFVVYVLGFSLGFGPIPWLMLGEILPAKIRGSAASLATAFNWACTFLVTKTFVDILSLLGPYGTFWLFAGFVVFSVAFIYTLVPETQGKSLEDIERNFIKVRRMSSIANLKPSPFSV